MRTGRPPVHGHRRNAHATPEYMAWHSMLNRCYNPKVKFFERYGGRGIAVCDTWKNSFETFLKDVGLRPSNAHSLSRIDNDKGYFPDNVRWETVKEQARNRRSNRLIEVDGKTLCLKAWSDISGIGRTTIRRRLDLGWSPKEAIFSARQHGGGYKRGD